LSVVRDVALSVRGLCDKLITHPEESYRLWCVVVCDLETWRMMRPWPALGRSATEGGIRVIFHDTFNSSRYVGYVCILGWYVKMNWSGLERKRPYRNLRQVGNTERMPTKAQYQLCL
jgi:hypothetical protein